MAWLTRHRASGSTYRYYYRSVKQGGRVRSVYIGKGPRGEACAREDARRREQRQREHDVICAEQAAMAEIETSLANVRGWTDLLMQATLILAGFHLYHGQWRRRRHGR